MMIYWSFTMVESKTSPSVAYSWVSLHRVISPLLVSHLKKPSYLPSFWLFDGNPYFMVYSKNPDIT